uniref:Toxin fusion protein n=1 Tax=Leifsonia xyli subsp. cynodontis TaxID=31966 RepID=Q27YZ2_LEIXC|nr:toxin fusion protein [Leifsonia xyli subsp. cynodontis]
MSDQSYRIEVSGSAMRALSRLPEKMADAVLRFLDGPLTENPMRVTKPLGAELDSMRSGYVGIAYRVLVRIDEDKRVVQVISESTPNSDWVNTVG